MESEKGFILTSSSTDTGGRAEVCYYGRGESGPFKVVITNPKAVFFTRQESHIPESPGLIMRNLELRTFNGEKVKGLYFDSFDHYYTVRRDLQNKNITIYESDVWPADRYLMERFIHTGVMISGEPDCKENVEGRLTVWTNPKLTPEQYNPDLKWLSIDIETGQRGELYSIALYGTFRQSEYKKVFIIAEEDETDGVSYLIPEQSEKRLLLDFIKEVRDYDPDLIIGWHVIGFDLKLLAEKCAHLSIPFSIGRSRKPVKLAERNRGLYDADIDGRIVIDGPQTLRTAFFKFEDFTLETVAQAVLGKGKDIRPDEDKIAEINRRFKEDKKALAKYNLEDAVLVTEIYRTTRIIEQLKTRSLITGLPMNRVGMSVAAFDFFMLPGIHRNGFVAPDVKDIIPGPHAAGGLVFTSFPKLYPHVVVLDFKSLYPTIMQTFFIDPLSRLETAFDPVETPVGIKFSRSRHVLPEYLEKLMVMRSKAKEKKDTNLSQAVKILMNSFYGVMGTTGCRFYHPDLPSAITGTGQWILRTTADYLRSAGYDVIYGDTDSVFVLLKQEEHRDPDGAGKELADRVNNFLNEKLMKDFGVQSRLEIEFEKHYRKFFLPAMRSSKGGARKRYAGLLNNDTMEFKGLEVVRSDWTALAKEFQSELFRRFFHGLEIRNWITAFVSDLKKGNKNDLLVYKKKLRRSQEKYVKTTPPQIKAARLLDPEGKMKLRAISYIMTVRGPVPVQMNPTDIDYQHYIDKQLKPLADGVLFTMNDSFDEIISGKQLDLF